MRNQIKQVKHLSKLIFPLKLNNLFQNVRKESHPTLPPSPASPSLLPRPLQLAPNAFKAGLPAPLKLAASCNHAG
jgi:hypothetical protein